MGFIFLSGMKININLSLFILISIFTCCTNDEPVDILRDANIIGKWEIESRLTNNVSNAAAICCEFIAFDYDTNTEDNIGTFQSENSGETNYGIFEINTIDKIINIDLNNSRQVLCQYQIDANHLSLTYTDENDNTIHETWTKSD